MDVTTERHLDPMSRGVARSAAVALVAGVPVVTAALGHLAWTGAVHMDLATATLPDLVLVVAASLGTACGTALIASGLALAVLPASSRMRRRVSAVTPQAWRRLVGAAVGGSMALAAGLPAAASDAGWVDPTAPGPDVAPPHAAVAASQAGWVESRADAAGGSGTLHRPSGAADPTQPVPPSAAAPRPPAPGPASHAAAAKGTHIVVRGESLWAITASIRGGNVADVAQAWPELYALNRDAVGPDPDLLTTGQELRIPAGWLS